MRSEVQYSNNHEECLTQQQFKYHFDKKMRESIASMLAFDLLRFLRLCQTLIAQPTEHLKALCQAVRESVRDQKLFIYIKLNHRLIVSFPHLTAHNNKKASSVGVAEVGVILQVDVDCLHVRIDLPVNTSQLL